VRQVQTGALQGVATVVAKLFNIVMPHTAYFGQKDAQKAVIIKRLALDMCAGVDVRVLPTVRESEAWRPVPGMFILKK
jgi:pantoate--beta-alanine ligase